MPDGSLVSLPTSSMPSDVTLMTGDALARLRDLPDGCVNAVCTSPPYFGLRRYGVDGEIGLEPRPSEYIERLVAVFREIRRVLRDDGSCWIVMGDSYANDTKWGGSTSGKHGTDLHGKTNVGRNKNNTGLKAKELIGIPWRLAFALSDDGWYRRHVIIWEKPNCLVESVKDRCTMSHEYVLHMTKSKTYYHDWFAITEPVSSIARINQSTFDSQKGGDKDYRNGTNVNRSARKTLENFAAGDSSRRNARSVWTIAVEPSYAKHTAMFPTRLSSRIIRAATPDGGVCAACGTPLRRILSDGEIDVEWQKACGADLSGGYTGKATKNYGPEGAQDASATKARILAGMKRRTTIGWARTCGCASEGIASMPALVLDPFSGAATTALSATRLGRDCIGIDLKAEYHDIAVEQLKTEGVKCLDTDGSRLPFRAVQVSRA